MVALYVVICFQISIFGLLETVENQDEDVEGML